MAIAVTSSLIIFFTYSGSAYAYPIYETETNTQSTTGNTFSGLFSPFQNFFRSINSVGKSRVRIGGQPSVRQNNVLMSGFQGAFERFDSWLNGIIGFRVSGLFVAILNILSWLLGLVKHGVDWLLSLLH